MTQTAKQLLESLRQSKERIHICYGDKQTGKDWEETHDVQGTVGRSTGTDPILLLIPNSRSRGGGAILLDCVVKITRTKDKRVLFQHPTYHKSA